MQADAFVQAHPGTVAEISTCVFGREYPCGTAEMERRLLPLGPLPKLDLGLTEPGTYSVRVLMTKSDGRTVLDATGWLRMHHADTGTCRHFLSAHGTLVITAAGRLTSP